MAHSRYDCNFGCPVEAALEVIGGKWKGVILYHLLFDTMRFNELRRLMPEITHRMLTRQLRDLEESRLISRKIYPEVPPRVEYSMTEYGKTLAPVIHALQAWGIQHLSNTSGKAWRVAPEKNGSVRNYFSQADEALCGLA